MIGNQLSNPETCLCEVCMQPYDLKTIQPKIIPCGHTLCTQCLKGIFQKLKVICPFCRQTFVLKKGIEELPFNFSLREIIEEKRIKKEVFCEEHPEYRKDHVCLKDQIKICLCCQIYGSHKNHEVLDFKTLEKRAQEKYGIGKRKIERFKERSSYFSIAMTEHKNDAIRLIEKTFEEIHLELKQTEDHLKDSIEKRLVMKLMHSESTEYFQDNMKLIPLLDKFENQRDKNISDSIQLLHLISDEVDSELAYKIYLESIEEEAFKTAAYLNNSLEKFKLNFHSKMSKEFKDIKADFSPKILRNKTQPSFIIYPQQTLDMQPLDSNLESSKESSICVLTLKGMIELKVDADDTVGSLKETIKELMECSGEINLEYNKKILEDSETIESFHVQSSKIPFIVKFIPKI